MESMAGINFTILQAAFFTRKYFSKLLFACSLWFVFFWTKEIVAKAALKMLVKLT